MNRTRAVILGAALAAGLVQAAVAQDQETTATQDQETVTAQDPETAAAQDQEGMLALLDVAPMVYWGIKRMPKFYSDRNMDRSTVDGSVHDRQYLFGSLGGLRDRAAESGLVLDGGLTQVVLGAVSGDGDGATYAGSADIWAAFDTGRAGLWPGGYFAAHLEGNWGNTVGGTGAVLPLNTDATMPGLPNSIALSELYLVQGLPGGFSTIIGKLDFGGIADKTFFANDERSQFMYEGLVNNPILGAFLKYTSIGGALAKQFTDDLNVQVLALSNSHGCPLGRIRRPLVGYDDLRCFGGLGPDLRRPARLLQPGRRRHREGPDELRDRRALPARGVGWAGSNGRSLG